MDLTVLETVLVAIAPAFASVVTILGSLVNIKLQIKKLKKESNEDLVKAESKLAKAYNDIATMKAKLESLEKIAVKYKEKK